MAAYGSVPAQHGLGSAMGAVDCARLSAHDDYPLGNEAPDWDHLRIAFDQMLR